MNTKIIECFVHDEIVKGGGVSVGAKGSGNDVLLKLVFNEFWDDLAKSITWYDAYGDVATLTMLNVDLLEAGTENTYLVPIPHEAKAKEGDLTMTIKGAEVDTHEISAEITAATWESSTLGEEDGTFKFVFNGEWYYSGTAVTLSDYGITVTGTPIDGDLLTVKRETGESTAITITATANHPELRTSMTATTKFKVLPSKYDQNALESQDVDSTVAEQLLAGIASLRADYNTFVSFVEQQIAACQIDYAAAAQAVQDASGYATNASNSATSASSSAQSAAASAQIVSEGVATLAGVQGTVAQLQTDLAALEARVQAIENWSNGNVLINGGDASTVMGE